MKALLALALIASPSARAQPDDEEISPASDAQARTCTVLYDLDVTFQITDTPLGAGDGTHRDLDGQLVLQFRADDEGAITVGPVESFHDQDAHVGKKRLPIVQRPQRRPQPHLDELDWEAARPGSPHDVQVT